MLDKRIKEALVKTKVVEKYKDLSKKYQMDLDDRFKNYDKDLAKSIFNDLGYYPPYDKRENFFRMLDTIDELEFWLTISLKYGIVEILWGVHQKGEIIFAELLGWVGRRVFGDTERFKKPSFLVYDDLKLLLIDSLELFEDFKKEVVKNFNEEE